MLNKNFFFKSGLILGYIILGLIILFFLFRGAVLRKIIEKVEHKLKTDYQLDLSIKESNFSGVSTISFQGIKLSQGELPPLFVADSIQVEPSLSALIAGGIKIKSFFLAQAKLDLTCKNDLCNYSSLIEKKEPAGNRSVGEKQVDAQVNYSSLLNRLIRKAFNLAPQKAEIRNFQVQFLNDTIHEDLMIPFYKTDRDALEGEIQDVKTGDQWKWIGDFSQSDETFDISFFPLNHKRQSIPVLNSFFDLDCSFDTIHIALSSLHYGNGNLDIKGHFSTENLRVYHERISRDTVKFRHLVFDSQIRVDKNSISLDSSSVLELNSIRVKPFIRLENGNSRIIDIKIISDPTQATDFFYSLPEGMFEVVRDVEADGTLEYSLVFHLDSSEPDSVIFNSTLTKSRFHLNNFGDENLLRIRSAFVHSVYENDKLFRNIIVGPENPYFTPLDSISPLFQSAVLTSEDGNFYVHAGFNEDAFRKSIATNYKAGRFQRGGSTISMQLVKNVYLTRKKTIARKAEEALIVWLLESNRLVSKSRMFEVYLNIIELGPGIYGIGEASEFYFSKHPSQLDLAESIFLASLLPHPKWYRSSFNDQGELKPHLADYYRVVSNFMLKKNLITQEQYDQLSPQVILSGPAREKIVKADSSNLIESIIPEQDLE
jgi:hypothetical protein